MDNTFGLLVQGLFERYYPRLCEFAYRMVGCEETARDLVQGVFATLLETSPHAIRNVENAGGYLYGMVKHAAWNSLRRRRITDRIMGQYEFTAIEEAKVTDNLIHAEILGELHAALQSLPSGCAQVCRMAYFDGKKNREIAEMLGVSINTIKTQKQRALALLRRKVTPQAFVIFTALLMH